LFSKEDFVMLRKPIVIVCLVLALGGMGGVLVFSNLHAQTGPLQGLVREIAPLVAPREPLSYRDTVKKVLPAVVSIETKGKAVAQRKIETPRDQYFNDPRIPADFRRFFEEFQQQPGNTQRFFQEFQLPVPEQPHNGFGSGFVIDAKGIILTNYHVVKDADQVVIHLHDGRKFVSRDFKSDPKTDLAIIRVQTKEALPCLQWANSDAMEIGDRVLAVGSPFGLKGSVSAGIVSGKGRILGITAFDDFVQTDAAINPGNSGGPLVNLEGQVVGINTAIKTQSGGSQGIGLAIASNAAKTIVDQLVHQGVVHRGYLGIQIRPLAPEVATRLQIPNRAGVLVAKVLDNSPAAKAGMQAGDVITALAKSPIAEPQALQRMVAAQPAGKALDVTVYRDGQEKRLSVMVEEQPTIPPPAVNPTPAPGQNQTGMRIDKIGVELRDLTPALAQQFGRTEKTGVLIAKVDPGSLAAEAGVEPGTLLTKVDNQAVPTALAAKQALERASLQNGVLMQVKTPEQEVGYIMIQASSER
jgi:serine protease Do